MTLSAGPGSALTQNSCVEVEGEPGACDVGIRGFCCNLDMLDPFLVYFFPLSHLLFLSSFIPVILWSYSIFQVTVSLTLDGKRCLFVCLLVFGQLPNSEILS